MRVEDIKDIAALSKEDRMKYDEAIKVYRDNLVTEAYARNEGRAKGYAKGFAEGFCRRICRGAVQRKSWIMRATRNGWGCRLMSYPGL